MSVIVQYTQIVTLSILQTDEQEMVEKVEENETLEKEFSNNGNKQLLWENIQFMSTDDDSTHLDMHASMNVRCTITEGLVFDRKVGKWFKPGIEKWGKMLKCSRSHKLPMDQSNQDSV
jgi:hypothetical protein